jgi:hypothetical protein
MGGIYSFSMTASVGKLPRPDRPRQFHPTQERPTDEAKDTDRGVESASFPDEREKDFYGRNVSDLPEPPQARLAP